MSGSGMGNMVTVKEGWPVEILKLARLFSIISFDAYIRLQPDLTWESFLIICGIPIIEFILIVDVFIIRLLFFVFLSGFNLLKYIIIIIIIILNKNMPRLIDEMRWHHIKLKKLFIYFTSIAILTAFRPAS